MSLTKKNHFGNIRADEIYLCSWWRNDDAMPARGALIFFQKKNFKNSPLREFFLYFAIFSRNRALFFF